jgi:hypothetical protein
MLVHVLCIVKSLSMEGDLHCVATIVAHISTSALVGKATNAKSWVMLIGATRSASGIDCAERAWRLG